MPFQAHTISGPTVPFQALLSRFRPRPIQARPFQALDDSGQDDSGPFCLRPISNNVALNLKYTVLVQQSSHQILQRIRVCLKLVSKAQLG